MLPDEHAMPVTTVYGVLSGTSLLVMLGIGLVAYLIHRTEHTGHLAWSAAGAAVAVPGSPGLGHVERVEAARELAALRAAAINADAAAEEARLRTEAASVALEAAESAYESIPPDEDRDEARRVYHAALAEAQAARHAEYVADTAARALRTEARLAWAELAAARISGEDLVHRLRRGR